MTIRLLTDYPFGRYTIPAGSIVSVFDSVTEAALIASRQAAASAAAVTWTVPVEVPDRSSPAVTGGAIASALQRASSDDLRTIRSAVAGDGNLLAWAGNVDALVTGVVTRDANGAAVASAVTWPDGATGQYTATTVSASFPGAVDAYTVTYVADGTTRTITQSAVTRNASGAVINRPALTIV
jgi:hypothetical protein